MKTTKFWTKNIWILVVDSDGEDGPIPLEEYVYTDLDTAHIAKERIETERQMDDVEILTLHHYLRKLENLIH